MIRNWLISTVAIWISAYVLPDIQVSGLMNTLLIAIVFGFVNAIIKPIIVILTLPLTIITLGLFLLIINALMVLITSAFIPQLFHVSGLGPAIIFTLVYSFITYMLTRTSQ